MASSTHRLSHITLLKEDNFPDWIIDVRAHLRKDKLWKYTQEVPKGESKSSEWQEKAQDAADFMTPTISPGVKRQLNEEEFNDGYLMINKLTSLLAPKGDAQFMRLTREYYTIQLNDFKDIPEFLTHVKVLEEQIDATNVELTKDKRTLLCLSMALPEYMRSFVQIWSMTQDMTAERAKEMLLEEHRREKASTEESKGMALVGKFGKQAKPKSSEGGVSLSAKWCPKCEKNGHILAECWEEHPELAPEWLQEKKKAQRVAAGNGKSFKSGYAKFPVDPYYD